MAERNQKCKNRERYGTRYCQTHWFVVRHTRTTRLNKKHCRIYLSTRVGYTTTNKEHSSRAWARGSQSWEGAEQRFCPKPSKRTSLYREPLLKLNESRGPVPRVALYIHDFSYSNIYLRNGIKTRTKWGSGLENGKNGWSSFWYTEFVNFLYKTRYK